MQGIRTNAAAELLGVSPNTLRTWERRFGYPSPRRTEGGHRKYELSDLEALRRALLETHNISSAIAIARQRGEGPTAPARLVEAFDRFDDQAADRAMEESLAVRSVERSVEELMLPALRLACERSAREPQYEFGCRWASGWFHAARRLAPPPVRSEAVLVFDSSSELGVDSLHVQALELAARRAGFRTLVLSVRLDQERLTRAVRAIDPTVVAVAGQGAPLDLMGRIVHATRHGRSVSRVVEYRGMMPRPGARSLPELGPSLGDAVQVLGGIAEVARMEQVMGRRRRSSSRSLPAPAGADVAASGA